MSTIDQEIQDAEREVADAAHRVAVRAAVLNAPKEAMSKAQARLQQARAVKRQEQLNADVAESARLAGITIADGKALIAAIEKHDLDGAVHINRAALEHWRQLQMHNEAVIKAALGDQGVFERLSHGLNPAYAAGSTMNTAKGDELLIRAGILFVLTGGQDARRLAFPDDMMAATRHNAFMQFRRINGWY